MPRLTNDQIYRMLQYRFDDFETFLYRFRRSGQIDDQRLIADAAKAAGKHCKRRVFCGFSSDGFGYAGSFLFNNRVGCLRRVVAMSKTGPAGRNDQVNVFALAGHVQGIANIIEVVRDNDLFMNLNTHLYQQPDQSYTRHVVLFAAGVADTDD